MLSLGKDKIRSVLRILQYTPVAITFFFTLSFWQEGDTEGALHMGAACIGLMLLNLLLHIRSIRDKVMAIRKPIGLVVSVVLISLGLYSLVMGSISSGIFGVLIGMLFLSMEILKGKWGIICCAVVLVLAVGILIWEQISDNRPYAIEREVGVQQGTKSKRHLYAGDPQASNDTILSSYG